MRDGYRSTGCSGRVYRRSDARVSRGSKGPLYYDPLLLRAGEPHGPGADTKGSFVTGSGDADRRVISSPGRWDDATAQYRKILEQNPNQPGIHYQLGRILLSKPMDPTVTEEAKKEFEAELKVNPTSPSAEFMLGDLAWRNQKTDEAIEHFSRAMQFDTGLSEAYLGLGMALNAAGKYSEAIPPLKKYTEMDPSDPAGYYQLATAYARTGNKPEAERLLALQRQLEKDKPRVISPPPQDVSQPH